jgi:ankyrin repeat protein
VHIAAYKGHAKTIIVFLQKCIDSYQLLDNSGKNFFHMSAEENRLEVFEQLLGKSTEKLDIPGIDEIFRNMINSGDCRGNTPLHLAVLKGKP